LAGRKNFVAGSILTAADVNAFLMDQSVMVFDDDTARTAAIPTASEGMVTYLKDTNAVTVFDGSVYKPVGTILQVVQTVKTDVFSESVSTGGVTGDAMVATITPTSASSKIMVSVQYSATVNGSAVLHAYLFRDAAVSAYIGDAVGSRARASTSSPGAGVSAGFAPSGSILYNDNQRARYASSITLMEVAA
jgi:hypothetical protein